jgi:hypothetical protein
LHKPPKIYPNLDFLFENKPSGNPGSDFRIQNFFWTFFCFCPESRKDEALEKFCDATTLPKSNLQKDKMSKKNLEV